MAANEPPSNASAPTRWQVALGVIVLAAIAGLGGWMIRKAWIAGVSPPPVAVDKVPAAGPPIAGPRADEGLPQKSSIPESLNHGSTAGSVNGMDGFFRFSDLSPAELKMALVPWHRMAWGLSVPPVVAMDSAVEPWYRLLTHPKPALLATAVVDLPPLPDAQHPARAWMARPQQQTQWPAFVMSMARGRDGALWIGSEDEGIWRYDPATGNLRQFTRKDGLGDDNGYAVAVDHQGRVWAGHLNHGVSVYNGNPEGHWQCYEVVGGLSRPDTLSGPIGERVFDICVCPTDGDVWIATSAGLSRYSVSREDWSYYTRGMSFVHGKAVMADEASALPSDQVQAITFDKDGNIYCATQCDGMAMADAGDDYLHWRTVRGPEKMPTAPAGQGLPTSLMNDVLVGRDGTVWAATTSGLAWSRDRGHSWRYVRGADWAEKVRGLYGGPPAGWTEKKPAEVLAAGQCLLPNLLAEDYVTCLAEDQNGLLWVGYRQQGYEAIDLRDGTQYAILGSHQQYVTALVPGDNALPAVGTYGNGQSAAAMSGAGARPAKTGGTVPMPKSAAAPTSAAINAMLQELRKMPLTMEKGPAVVALDDDWRTQGAWLGRYGRYWACLAAMATGDYLWGAGPQPVEYIARIGPHHAPGDFIRYWIDGLYASDPGALEIPPVYLDSRIVKGFTKPDKNRREAEWDDHGEVYPMTLQGPDLYCTLRVPSGLFYLSLYDRNKVGHEAKGCWRDYRVSIRSHPSDQPLQSVSDFDQWPQLAHVRIRDFWGGVWKRFLVRGPAELTARIERNGSLNTILRGVMLDEVEECPPPYFPQEALATSKLAAMADNDQLIERLQQAREQNPAWWAVLQRSFYGLLLRHYEEGSKSSTRGANTAQKIAVLGTCEYQVNLYSQWEESQKQRGMKTAREIEKSLRWNQAIPAYSGRGNVTVIEYWAAREEASR